MTIRLSRNYTIDGQYIYTHSEEPTISDTLTGFRQETFDHGKHTVSLDGESYSGFAMISRFLRRSNNWNFTFDFDQVGPSYQTQIGWDPWNDYRNGSFATWYNFFVRKGILQIVTPQVYVGRRWNFDDEQKFENINFGANATLSWAQTQLGLFGHRNSERWYGIDFDHLDGFNFDFNSRPIQAFSYYIGGSFEEIASLGTLSRADQVRWSGSISLQPIDRLIISPSLTSVTANEVETNIELFQQNIFRTRLQYQFTRSLSLRLVVQHNDAAQTYLTNSGYMTFKAESWEVDPLVTYRISPFSVFFIGSTYDISGVNSNPRSAPKGELDERHFFMKLQYLFQV